MCSVGLLVFTSYISLVSFPYNLFPGIFNKTSDVLKQTRERGSRYTHLNTHVFFQSSFINRGRKWNMSVSVISKYLKCCSMYSTNIWQALSDAPVYLR